jgi:hypothetical protein
MLIAIVSTLISSVALLGVATGLFLQARQLRTNQTQAARASQIELMRLAIENPDLVAKSLGVEDPDAFIKNTVRNWYLGHLSTSYDIRTLAKPHLKRLIAELFASEESRLWWELVRSSYGADVTSRRQREFVTMVNEEFEQVAGGSEAAIAVPSTEATPDKAAPTARGQRCSSPHQSEGET